MIYQLEPSETTVNETYWTVTVADVEPSMVSLPERIMMTLFAELSDFLMKNR